MIMIKSVINVLDHPSKLCRHVRNRSILKRSYFTNQSFSMVVISLLIILMTIRMLSGMGSKKFDMHHHHVLVRNFNQKLSLNPIIIHICITLNPNLSKACESIFNNLTHLSYKSDVVQRESSSVGVKSYVSDYKQSLELIMSSEFDFALILEDDFRFCIENPDYLIMTHNRLILTFGSGAIAVAYHRSIIPKVIKMLSMSNLPVDNAINVHFPVSRFRTNMVIEDGRASLLNHLGRSQCFTECLDQAFSVFDFNTGCQIWPCTALDNTDALIDEKPFCDDINKKGLWDRLLYSNADKYTIDLIINRPTYENYFVS